VDRRPSSARQRLLDAALGEFARRGFAGASIRSITRELGLRESAFYAHFASKQEAYDELFAEGSPAVVTKFATDLPIDEPPQIALPRLAQQIMTAWTTPRARALASIVLREAFEGEGEKRGELLKGIDLALDSVQRRLLRWQEAGLIRQDLPARTLAFEFLSPLMMARMLYYNLAATQEEVDRGASLTTQLIATFTDMIVVP